MFRTRRKLAEIMFSKTAIVRMLKDGEADMFKPSEHHPPLTIYS